MTIIVAPLAVGTAPDADAARVGSAAVRSPRPHARGDLSAWVLATLDGREPAPLDRVDLRDDPLVGDDFHLALHVLYELGYRGIDGVPARFETHLPLIRMRQQLEDAFESALRSTFRAGSAPAGEQIDELLARADGPSLSSWMLAHADIDHVRDFAVHRSAYQLKEADPHSWALPRLAGPRKAALVEIQMDEYGNGNFGEGHAELFAALMQALDLDARYGAYVDRLPGVTLATGNTISLFGLQRRLAPALLGHLAVFEMTSVGPMGRYAELCDRLALPPAVRRFYDVHVEADEHHGRLAREVLIGGDTTSDGLPASEVAFGAAALMAVEERMTRHLLAAWQAGEATLLP
jgi:hypothetical protein